MIEERESRTSDSVVAASTRRDAQTELPWICEGCGQFVVTRTAPVDIDEPPQHDCPVAARNVFFVPYQSSEQAAQIKHRLGARERTPRP